jgi:hypothetical protein
MTLTSDGRLIGKAAPEPKKRVAKQNTLSGVQLVEIYTNGKNISAAMIKYTTPKDELAGVQDGISLDVGHEAVNKIQGGWYDNIKHVDGKIDFASAGIKKKSFKSVQPKLLKILLDNWGMPSFRVEKSRNGDKYNYDVIVENGDANLWDHEMLVEIVHALVTDAMYTSKIKVICYDSTVTTVSCMTGINDVRKALKLIK